MHKKLKSIFSLCQMALAIYPLTHHSIAARAENYSGHSDYRLLLLNQPDRAFDPNMDLLIPSNPNNLTEAQLRTLKKEKINDALLTASMKSLIPLMSLLNSENASNTKNVFDLLLAASHLMKQTLFVELESLINDDPSLFPLTREVFLVPWNAKRDDLFYSAEKITVEPSKMVNVLGAVPHTPGFDTKLTEEIKKLQQKLYASSSPLPAQLLGLRYQITFNPFDAAEFSRVLNIRILLALKPGKQPFKNENDQVKFFEQEVPNLGGRQPIAALTLALPLTLDTTDPKLHIEIGDFDSFQAGEFKVVEKGRHRSGMVLHAIPANPKLSKVGLDFVFKTIDLNLKTIRISNLDTFLRPGLHLNGANFTIGGFHLESIDQNFQTEINKMIEQQIKDAIAKGKSKLDSGLMKVEWIQEAFLKLFGGQK